MPASYRDPNARPTEPRHVGQRRRTSVWWKCLFVVFVFLLTYTAASYWLGFYAQQQIERYAESAQSIAPIDIVVLHHERGIWRSSGIMQISPVQQQSASNPSLIATSVIQVSYQINHAIWPSRLAHLTWQAKFVEPQRLVLNDTIMAKPALLSGQGEVDWQGQYVGDIAMSAMEKQLGFQRLVLSPMRGEMVLTASQQQLRMQWPFIETHANGLAMRLDDFSWSIDSERQEVKHQIGIARAQWPSESVVALGIRAATKGLDGANVGAASEASVQWQANADMFTFSQYRATDVRMSGALEGLHPESVQALGLAAAMRLGLIPALTMSTDDLQAALRQLVMNGFEAKLSEFSAKSDWANVQGRAQLRVSPIPPSLQTEDAQVNVWDPYIRSEAEVHLQGLPPTLAGLGLLTGMLVRTPNGVKTSYVLADGRLTLNGKIAPAITARPVLLLLNRWLNQLTGNAGDQNATAAVAKQRPRAEVFPVNPS